MRKNIKNISKELEEVITLLSENVDNELTVRIVELIKSDLDENGIKLSNVVNDPDKLNLFIFSNMEIGKNEFLELLLKKVYGDAVHFHLLYFLYSNYDFIERHIAELCVNKEGAGCSVDKARFITNLVRIYALTGEVQEFEVKKKDFYKPKFGCAKDWIDYVSSLYDLNRGRVNEYLPYYNKLLKADVKKFKYVIRQWKVKFKDTNEEFLVAVNYDNPVCPLRKAGDDDDVYLIHKNIIGERDFEINQGGLSLLFPQYRIHKDLIEISTVEKEDYL